MAELTPRTCSRKHWADIERHNKGHSRQQVAARCDIHRGRVGDGSDIASPHLTGRHWPTLLRRIHQPKHRLGHTFHLWHPVPYLRCASAAGYASAAVCARPFQPDSDQYRISTNAFSPLGEPESMKSLSNSVSPIDAIAPPPRPAMMGPTVLLWLTTIATAAAGSALIAATISERGRWVRQALLRRLR